MVSAGPAAPPGGATRLPPVATVPVLVTALSVSALLVAFAGRYGYHRDELYFLAAARRLAWGYPDQPPFVAVLARAVSVLAPGSLVALRAPSALAAGAVVVLAAVSARELGARQQAQVFAALCMAASGVTRGMGHLLSTATFDLLAWAAIVWLVLRVLRTRADRLLVVVGLVAGVGLLDNYLVAVLLAGLLVAVALVGPRDLLASGWLWAGAAVAAAMWLPNLLWQATHGWPQLQMSRAIAAGGSGTSEPRSLFIPLQVLFVGGLLAPFWIAGLVVMLRAPRLAAFRAVAVAYLVLAVAFLALGGKPYYLAGLYPALFAAGAQPTLSWLGRRRVALRRGLVTAAVAVTAVSTAVVTLPVVPVTSLHATPVVSLNYDAGETVGWPAFTTAVATAWRSVAPAERSRTVVLTGNYGEAGAVQRYGARWGLPPVYSGHNGFGLWGPPPATTTTVVAVGFRRATLSRWFRHVEPVATVDNGVGVDNDEQGMTVWVARGPRRPWRQMWPAMRHLG